MTRLLNRLKISKIPIFPKLVLTFLIITIPLFSISLIMNELGKKEVERQITNSIKTTVHYYFLTMEQEIDRIIRTQQEFINDKDLLKLSIKYSILSDYDRSEAVNSLLDKLNAFKDSSGYIQDISIYIASNDSTITTSGGEGEAYSKKGMEEIARAVYDRGYPMTFWNDRMYLNLTYPNYALSRETGKKPPLFIQNIELSVAAIRNTLKSLPVEGGAVLFNEDWTVAREEYKALYPAVKEQMHVATPLPAEWTESVSIGKEKYIAIYEKSMLLDASLLIYFPEDVILGQLKRYGTWFWLLVGCTLIIAILFSYGIYLLIHRPLQFLIKRFRNVEEGNFDVIIKPVREDEFGYLFVRFEQTVQRLRTLIDELYVQKIRLQQSELKQLQMQITPHFLYNSFFILHRLIKNDQNEKAELVSKNLGDYFQYITRNGLEEVRLEDEVKHVRSYVEIQNVRFSNRIQVDFEPLPDVYRDVTIPRLILQPLVENAYEHGLGQTIGNGELKIGFRTEGDRLYFSVEDNGQGFTEEEREALKLKMKNVEAGETTGIVNIQRRLYLKYGDQAGLEIIPGKEQGAIVRIYIPHGKGDLE